jgi:hypothetical protein
MEHIYEYSACPPSDLIQPVITEQYRRFWEERPIRNGQKYLIHHEEFLQRLEDGTYRKCAYATEWQLLSTGSENSNSRVDYSETDNVDPAIIQTTTNPVWEVVKLFP